jgi:hypothetical protein
MPRSLPAHLFFLIVSDRDRRIFTVEGPMSDDRPWNKAVARAQDAGREVKRCNGGSNRDEAIRAYSGAYGLKFVERGSIVQPTIDDGSP